MEQLLRLRAFVKPYRARVILNLLVMLAITGLTLSIPEIIQRIIDDGLAQGNYRLILIAGATILGIGIFTAFLDFWNTYLSEWVAAKIGFDLRNQLYDHIQHLSFSFHDHAQTGQLISRCIEDVRAIERFAGLGIIQLVRMLLLAAGIVILMVNKNPLLAGIALLPLIPLALITTRFGSRVGQLFYAVDHALGELSAKLQENVNGVQVVRAFAREPHEVGQFQTRNRELYDARVNIISQWSRVMPTTHFLVALGTILILLFGGQMVIAGQMTIGEVVAFNSFLLMLAAPVQQLTWLVNGGGEAAAGIRRVFDVLDQQPRIKTPPDAHVYGTLEGRVSFEQVSLAYQDQTSRALHDISFDILPNQVVALIGPTGSGKSSLVNLIPRFYDASQGKVKIDGHDVKTVDLVSLRSQIGIVLQSSLLFSDTIRNNIAYGRPEASVEEVVAAAQAAQADAFIRQLPAGYDTVVGERGVTLSGGQRQRVAIARALLMQPRILILDDSTSSVDTRTEREIQKALADLMEGRTTFVIAHRLSTVRRADIILVLDQGRIIERGTHYELLKQQGLYREIYDLQLRDQDQFQEALESIDDFIPSDARRREYGIDQD